ncbi:MAG: hypothetical protein RH917_20245 [Lacipirellulaceae bacterium]
MSEEQREDKSQHCGEKRKPRLLERYSETINPMEALDDGMKDAWELHDKFNGCLFNLSCVGGGVVGVVYGIIVGSPYYLVLGAVLLALFIYLNRLDKNP